MRKRKSNEQTLKNVIDDMLKVYRLDRGVNEAGVKLAWNNVMGPMISGKTRDLKLYNGTLKIWFNSGVLKEEFSFQKPRLIELLNEELGNDVVKMIEIY
ncbi:MAG: hypothetical protein ACI84C_000711 [Flavobacteriales bacterium]|jgi:hypothetical protein